jgi:hypothetical protein
MRLREVLSGYPRMEPHPDCDERRYALAPGQAALLASSGEQKDPIVTVPARRGLGGAQQLAEFERWVHRGWDDSRSSFRPGTPEE